MKTFLVLIVLILVLVACAPSNPVPAEPEPTPSPTGSGTGSEGKLDQAYIELEISGGFAGKTEKWIIYPDGRVTSHLGKETQVNSSQVTALITSMENIGFFEMEDRYGGFGTCNDCFEYKITASNGEKVKTVTAIEGGENVPNIVWDIVNQINTLVEVTK